MSQDIDITNIEYAERRHGQSTQADELHVRFRAGGEEHTLHIKPTDLDCDDTVTLSVSGIGERTVSLAELHEALGSLVEDLQTMG